jgi:hypothetical protein
LVDTPPSDFNSLVRFRSGSVLLALCVAVLCSAVVRSTSAQTATLRGFVVEDGSGEPLTGVNVALRDVDGDLLGAVSDAEGFYIIAGAPAAIYELQASFIGFETVLDTLLLGVSETVTYNVRMREASAELGELVVESVRERQAANVTAGAQSITPADIELIPSPDVSADLVNYVVTLPGVVATGDRGGALFIRGGEPTQNLVQLDGMLVFAPFHIIGFYSAFPSDIVRNADIYAGGYGAKFGGRLSSVLDVSSRSGNMRRFGGAVTVAPFVSSARIEGPLWKDRISVMASVRQSIIEHGAARIVDQNLPFEFGDQFGKLHASLSSTSQISVSVLHTSDRGVLGPSESSASLDNAPDDEVRWENLAYGLRYIVLPSSLPVFAEIVLSSSRLNQEFGPGGRPDRSSDVSLFNAAASMTYFTRRVNLQWGLFIQSSSLNSELGGQFQNVEDESEFVTEAGLYAEPDFKITSQWSIQPGIRLHSFPSKSETFLEPRLRLIFESGGHRVSAAGGIYHQQIVGLNDRRLAGDVFTAWTTAPLQLIPTATHAIVGYGLAPGNGVQLSIEAFWKRLKDLSVPVWTAFPKFTVDLQPADGYVRGADARASIDRGWLYGFVSYGYANVTYEAKGASIPLWYGDSVKEYAPPHDRTHQVSALVSVSLRGFDLSLRWQYGSGLPFSRSVGFDQFVLIDGQNDVRTDPGQPRVLYGEPYDGRLPDYHRFDVSLARRFPFKAAALTVQAGLINGYDRRNLFYMDLFTLQRVDQMPLIPSLGLKLEVN